MMMLTPLIASIPKQVKIAGSTIRVVFRDYPDNALFGEWSLDDKTIYLRKGIPLEVAEVTLYHEMLHAALELGGVAFFPNFPDEPVVRALEHLFLPAYDAVRERIANS